MKRGFIKISTAAKRLGVKRESVWNWITKNKFRTDVSQDGETAVELTPLYSYFRNNTNTSRSMLTANRALTPGHRRALISGDESVMERFS